MILGESSFEMAAQLQSGYSTEIPKVYVINRASTGCRTGPDTDLGALSFYHCMEVGSSHFVTDNLPLLENRS